MKILFLGQADCSLGQWLVEQGEKVQLTSEKITFEEVQASKPELIVSYNYRHILAKDILSVPQMGAINLHISFLPWNRGADPNPWSFLEGTPKGVTIHLMDEGIDTGDILFQKEVVFKGDETLSGSYQILQEEIQSLFKDKWQYIKQGAWTAKKQPSGGSCHRLKDREIFLPLMGSKSWDISVSEFVNNYEVSQSS